MSVIWVICGAGRGVGKTHVARQLCRLLPSSAYAKCGHGRMQHVKPAQYFTDQAALEAYIAAARDSYEHIVVEANAWAHTGRGDVTIFLDGVPGVTEYRPDAGTLAALADLRVTPDASAATWRAVLQRQLASPALCDAVCQLLIAQQQYLLATSLQVRTKVWLEMTGAHVLGPGLARLLDQIDRTGSLQNAAAAEQMSYRYAWKLIRLAEQHLGRQLVHRQVGGTHGGGSLLSAEGVHLLQLFRQLESDVAAFARQRFQALVCQESHNVHA